MAFNMDKLFILVHFYEEKKFSVLRLKHSVTLEETEISSWNTTRIIDVLWNGETYPAYILQFGENKKEMDALIDKIAMENVALSDIPIMQVADKMENRTAAKSMVTCKPISNKKQKLVTPSKSGNILDEVRLKISSIETSKYSRFVGDLMEVVFGREVLGNIVIKGIKGKSKKTNILDPEKIQDIQMFVQSKFNIDQTLIRAAIRRKLNIADRLMKETQNKVV